MRPSDSLVSIGLSSGHPLLLAYRRRVLLLRETLGRSGHVRRAPACATRARGRWVGSPRCRFCQEKRGSPRCLGRPLLACRGHVPRRCVRLSPLCEAARCCLPAEGGLGHRKAEISRLVPRGPQARVPTHRRRRCLRRRKARYRPGGLPLAGRVSHPLDDFSEFRSYRMSLLLSDQPCLVAALELPIRERRCAGSTLMAADLPDSSRRRLECVVLLGRVGHDEDNAGALEGGETSFQVLPDVVLPFAG